MVKKSKTVSRLPQVGIVIICLASIFVFVTLFLVNQNASKELVQLKKEYENNQVELDSQQKSLTLIQDEIDKYKNLKTTIQELKSTYFANIKQLEDNIQQNKTDKRIAYLTFDDGPYASITGKFLDILKEYDVPATFFVLGKPAQTDLYKREIKEGHTLANHSYSHKLGKNGIYTSVDRAVNDFMQLDEYISSTYDYSMNIFRFPGGSATAGSKKSGIASSMSDKGYGYVDWGTTDGSGGYRTSVDDYYSSVVKGIGNQKIVVVLMHDYSDLTLGMLPDLIEYFQKENFIMLPLFHDSIKIMKS